jgi:hypothetical protein
MTRRLAVAALALLVVALPASAAGLSGRYIEARTCDVWTGPCFANAEINLTGRHAVLGWQVDKGKYNNVALDGLGVVAVVEATDTLGAEQNGVAKSVFLVDQRATKAQREALIKLAKSQGGALLKNVVLVQASPVDLQYCPCKSNACAVLKAGSARIETRCIGDHDTICGNESAFFPPLTKGVKAVAAYANENSFSGKGLKENWKDSGRRSAYVGSFEAR